LAKMIQFSVRETEASLFSEKNTDELQLTSSGDFIVLRTNFIERAIAYLAQKGIAIKPDTKQILNGQLIAVDVNLEIEGFALRLIQV